MAKIIKLTPNYIEEVRKAFEEALSSTKLSDGKINFTKTFGTSKRDATVYFTELAWLKMQTLIREFDKEVAWHGVAMRGEDPSKDEYYITDILVYPQEVTGATVNTDQEKYQMWLMEHEDDVFNNIRMQGHSHVNMGTTPSSVDTSLYDRILDQLDDDMFYIFMIWNKKGEKTIKIYDLAKNVLFETQDCTVKILDDGTGIEQFLKNAKSMVKDKVYTSPSSPSAKSYTGYSGYNGYNGNYNYEERSAFATSSPKKEESKESEKKSATPSDKKSGKRKGKRKTGMKNASEERQLSLYRSGAYDYDDDDDPYGPFGYRNGYGY